MFTTADELMKAGSASPLSLSDGGILGNLSKGFDEMLNDVKRTIGGGAEKATEQMKASSTEAMEAATEAAEAMNEPQTVPDKNASSTGMMSKIKQTFNDQSPMVIGLGAGLISRFLIKTGWITSGVIAAAGYVGKQQLDKKGGLSDYIPYHELEQVGQTQSGSSVYFNPHDKRTYKELPSGKYGRMK